MEYFRESAESLRAHDWLLFDCDSAPAGPLRLSAAQCAWAAPTADRTASASLAPEAIAAASRVRASGRPQRRRVEQAAGRASGRRSGWPPQVTIYRDAYGVAARRRPRRTRRRSSALPIAQAEDYFWQIEDNYILALGRYAEVHGSRGLNSDLLNRAFEIVPRAKAAFAGARCRAANALRGVRRRAELLPGHASRGPAAADRRISSPGTCWPTAGTSCSSFVSAAPACRTPICRGPTI